MPQQLIVSALPSRDPEIGRALWTLAEARQRTLRVLQREPELDLDDAPEGLNTAGTLLYHVAAIELDWLFAEVRGEDFPSVTGTWFHTEVRDAAGRLTPVTGEPLQRHLDRLAWVRQLLLDTYTNMTLEAYRTPRVLPEYSVTPEWVLRHLALHEMGHTGQLLSLRTMQATRV